MAGGGHLIIDAFIFRNEWECLDIRLSELAPYVDKFLLVEGDTTFQGDPKPLEFIESGATRSAKPIVYVGVKDFPETGVPWVREGYQRDAVLWGLEDADPNDIVMLSDADEIPRGEAIDEAVEALKGNEQAVSLEQSIRFYHVNNVCQSMLWAGTQVCTVDYLRRTMPQQVRNGRNSAKRIPNGGWHFCNLGDVDWLIGKLESFSHEELNKPGYKDREHLQHCIDTGAIVDGRDDMPFEIDGSDLPAYVTPEHFPRLFREEDRCRSSDQLTKAQ